MPRVSSALVDVWKERALAAEAREQTLLAHLMELKAKGAYVPTPGRVVPPGPDPEAEALRRREMQALDGLVEQIKHAKGVTDDVAREEAQRIRAIGLSTFVEPTT